jgi:hypothetical protein
MTDWGAHHFGGATFAVDVRDQQPVEVTFHQEAEGNYLSYKYASGMTIYHNKPKTDNLKVEGTEGEKKEPKPVPSYKGEGGIYGDFIHCVKTREILSMPSTQLCSVTSGSSLTSCSVR